MNVNIKVDIEKVQDIADVLCDEACTRNSRERDMLMSLIQQMITCVEDEMDKYDDTSLEHVQLLFLSTNLRKGLDHVYKQRTKGLIPQTRDAIAHRLEQVASIYNSLLTLVGADKEDFYLSMFISSDDDAPGHMTIMGYNNHWEHIALPDIRIQRQIKQKDLDEQCK